MPMMHAAIMHNGLMPACQNAGHLGNNDVLDDDVVFLHLQVSAPARYVLCAL